ncbi:BspA family leucine-rich repeat surface protein [Marivirga sp. S37H4]|uniref:BspA family leucine-rich repeat surface protein n=1 Tax=Marivirga aurantiaca TaxID=2802615 RepID=A0A934WYB9_9BACT|nr:BspA family leucine-rich repeat surface protein [Marivirga aurantiaca]MBK6265418.1 BspA family leucine-rich repeat surface protein [Marivirga aurantiaca]
MINHHRKDSSNSPSRKGRLGKKISATRKAVFSLCLILLMSFINTSLAQVNITGSTPGTTNVPVDQKVIRLDFDHALDVIYVNSDEVFLYNNAMTLVKGFIIEHQNGDNKSYFRMGGAQLLPNSTYHMAASNGLVFKTPGSQNVSYFPGNTSNFHSFTTGSDTADPSINTSTVNITPGEMKSVNGAGPFTILFDEVVNFAAGNIVFHALDANGVTKNVDINAGQVTITTDSETIPYTVLTIDPQEPLISNGIAEYYVSFPLATDLSGNSASLGDISRKFRVTSVYAGNSAPTNITLGNSTVVENNLVGANIGNFSTTDANVGDTHTYSLVSGEGDQDNANFTIDNNSLKAARSFDFEEKSSYSIRVRTSDGFPNGTFEKSFTINITNFDEAPTGITLSPNNLEDNNAVNAIIGSFSTVDEDNSDSYTYALVAGAGSTDNGSFNISGNNLRASVVFDYDIKNSFSIRVRVNDTGGGIFEQVFTINIVDYIAPPALVATSPTIDDTDVDATLSQVTLNFDRPVYQGTTGYLYVRDITNATLKKGFAHSSTGISGWGTNTLSFDVSDVTFVKGIEYEIFTNSDYFASTEGTLFRLESNIYRFTIDNTGPQIVSVTPAASSTGISVFTNVTIEFDEPVFTGAPAENLFTLKNTGTNEYTYINRDDAIYNGNQVTIPVTGSLDYNTLYWFYLTSGTFYDASGNSSAGSNISTTTTFTTEEKSNEAPTGIQISSNSIFELLAANTEVGQLTSTDPNAGDTHTYTLVSGVGSTDNASFNISGDQLRSSIMFDFETKESYSIRVRSTDQDGLFYERQFAVAIENANDAPHNLTLSSTSIDEGNAINAIIGTFSATDEDAGDTQFFDFTTGAGDDDNNNVFNIVGNELRASNTFDYETKSSYSILIAVFDASGDFDLQQFTISINDVVEVVQQPFITTWQTTTPSETITIPTTGIGYNYTVDWGDGTVENGFTGNAIHEYATAGTYTVSISGDFPRIYFANAGDKAKIMTIEQWGDIAWANMAHAFSGCNNLTYNATDQPDLSAVEYMSGMFKGALSFNGAIGDWDVSNVISMSQMFYYASSFNQDLSNWVVTNVQDMRYMFAEAENFNQDISNWNVINVTNMRNMFESSGFNQNISSWDVGKVQVMTAMFYNNSAFNQDISGWNVGVVEQMEIMFKDATSFNQDLSTWNVTAATNMVQMFSSAGLSMVNYDNTLAGWAAQTVQSGVTLGATGLEYCNGEAARNTLINTYGWTISGDSKACPNNAPTAIALSVASIDENNTVGDVIGQLSTTDADGSDAHTYSLVAGTGDSDNSSFTINGNDLEANEVFDFEIKSSYSIRVQSNDGNGGTFEETFTITINDVFENTAPTDISLSTSSIAENNSVGDLVATISTTDMDAGQSFTYSLANGAGDTDNSSFSISGSQLIAEVAFDFESKSSYNVRIKTNDGAGGSFTKSFIITVTDLDESGNTSPTDLQLTSSTIDENNAIGDIVGSFTTTDPDATDVHSYELVPGNGDTDNIRFTIDDDQLKANTVFDFETKSSYSIRVRTSDGNGGTHSKAFAITIINVEEKLDQIITFEPLTGKKYGDDEFELTATSNSGLAVTFSSSDETVASVSGSTVTIVGAGTTTIIASQSGDVDYHPAEAVEQSFSITKTSLSVTADDQNIIYGDDLPELTYTITGFVYSENESSLSSPVELSVSADVNSDAGEYVISASGAVADNYTFSYTNAILTINKANQSIHIAAVEDIDIDETTEVLLSATSSSGLPVSYEIVSGPATLNDNVLNLTGTGTVEVRALQEGNQNYNPAVATTTFRVVEDPCAGFVASAIVLQNPSCNGEVSGSFEINLDNGTAPFTYSYGGTVQDDGLFENVGLGEYEVIVTDINGCQATVNVSITEPESISISAEVTDNTSINGNGSISLTISGGTGDYSYDWSNGATTAIITDLEIGEYTVTVTDEAGCILTESFMIGGVTANAEKLGQQIKIYPNPTLDIVTLQHEKEMKIIKLYDATGKLLQNYSCKGREANLNIQHLPSGLYFIQLENSMELHRILKK